MMTNSNMRAYCVLSQFPRGLAQFFNQFMQFGSPQTEQVVQNAESLLELPPTRNGENHFFAILLVRKSFLYPVQTFQAPLAAL